MATIEIDLDLPEGIEVRGYERIEQGHAFEIEWAIPDPCVCDRCGYSEPTRVEYKDKIHVIRDLDLWDQPSFFVYQPPFHRCSRCNRRQWLLPPIKRKHVTYTYRFEHQVLRMLIGSTEEEVARRLGISAEMVHVIVKNQLKEEQQIDPDRVITDVAAAEQCLDRLTREQREQVRVHRTDMSPAYASACAAKLPHSQQTIDRFHVAQKLGKMADRARKKDPCVQEDTLDESKEGFQVQYVGVS